MFLTLTRKNGKNATFVYCKTHHICQNSNSTAHDATSGCQPVVYEEGGEDYGTTKRIVDKRGLDIANVLFLRYFVLIQLPYLSNGSEKDVEKVQDGPVRFLSRLVAQISIHYGAVAKEGVPRVGLHLEDIWNAFHLFFPHRYCTFGGVYTLHLGHVVVYTHPFSRRRNKNQWGVKERGKG